MYRELIGIFEYIFKGTYYEDVKVRIGELNRGRNREVAIIFQGNNQEHHFIRTPNMGSALNITVYFLSDKEVDRIEFYEELKKIYDKIKMFNCKHDYKFKEYWIKFREGNRGLVPVGINDYGQYEYLIDLNIYY